MSSKKTNIIEEKEGEVGNKESVNIENKKEISLITEEQKMKQYLDSCPKISFMCPLAQGETEGSVETVCMNGYTMIIQKGVLIDLPKPVVEILANKYKVGIEAITKAKKSQEGHQKKEIEEALS